MLSYSCPAARSRKLLRRCVSIGLEASTHTTAEATANLTNNGTAVVTSPVQLSSGSLCPPRSCCNQFTHTPSLVGIWSLICHGRVVRGVAPNRVQVGMFTTPTTLPSSSDHHADFAYGTSITVKRHIPKISKGALVAVGVIAGLVAAGSVILLVAYGFSLPRPYVAP